MKMPLPTWLKMQKDIDDAASIVAEQMKLTLDRSDAIDLMKEIDARNLKITSYIGEIEAEQKQIKALMHKIRKIL